jgi:hypothetical protein
VTFGEQCATQLWNLVYHVFRAVVIGVYWALDR